MKCGNGVATRNLALEPPAANPTTVSTNSGEYGAVTANALPSPPSLHWAVVLALSVVTVGFFAWIWAFVQAIFVKRLTGTWKPLAWLSVGFTLVVFGLVNTSDEATSAFGRLAAILFVPGVFSIRRYVVRHYNSTEPIKLKIGWWWTALGSVFYLQHHLTRIAKLKREQAHLIPPYAIPQNVTITYPKINSGADGQQ